MRRAKQLRTDFQAAGPAGRREPELTGRFNAALDKFFSADAQAQVTVTVEKSGQTVEITVRDKGLILRAE